MALLFVAPIVILSLIGWLIRGQSPAPPKVPFSPGGPGLDQLDHFGPAFIGIVVFFLVYIVTSVSFLRERTQGTLERLMASPLRQAELVVGYMLSFGSVALVQSLVVVIYALYVLGIYNQGNVGLIFVVTGLMAIAAVNLGIFLSMFARTEFQAVQFIPLAVAPQILLAGVFFSVDAEPLALQYVSHALPLTYAIEALRDVMLRGSGLDSRTLQVDLLVLLVFAGALVAAAGATLRRRS